jgi:trimeric autotransporter adhesin
MQALHSLNRFNPGSTKSATRRGRRSLVHSRRSDFDILENRELLATFTVSNLQSAGAGSLRQAIIASDAHPGADTINFGVAGTIRITRTSLPAITDSVDIDGTSAPSFAGSPVVTINFAGTQGFRFARGSDGSTLESLSIVRASGAGVTLAASQVTVQGNVIGLLANGKSFAGNRGDGVRINATSHGDLIGQINPVSSVTFSNTSGVSTQPVTAWQGIRATSTSGQYLISGTSDANGLLYEGPISGNGGTSFSVNFPLALTTSVYGPDQLSSGGVRLVGSYRGLDGNVHGFMFQGTTSDLSLPVGYQTIDYPGATYTYVHSTMGDFAVGNADGPEGNAPLGTGHAFLYDVATSSISTDIIYPGSTTTTAYGIWYNGGTSYTIAGGYSDGVVSNLLTHGYLVDFDAATGQFSNWTTIDYSTGLLGQQYATHFEGISSAEKGVYTMSADWLPSGSGGLVQGSLATVRRNTDGSFGPATWVNLNDPNVPGTLTANSVAGNQVVGVISSGGPPVAFQATVNTAFQLSNVISGNGGNGIGIYGARDNVIAMNEIGTDSSGTLRRGNAKNGILVTNRAVNNVIGGQATGGNDPTAGVIVRPPQGNLISSNGGNGVLVTNRATQTVLSGNFVGTSGSGNSALGNRLDGVAIVNASGNSLIGCTFQQSPFVFYNVLSGNGGNGLRVTNSRNTTVQANFMGIGADNAVRVANRGDGLLDSGSSTNTQVGGVIPLGNVISGNNKNGIEVSGKARGFVSFNTFGGTYAFGGAAPNKRDGILITSTGGNNLVRTSIISGNLGNGIEISGNATGVQVTDTAVGTNSDIQTPIPNGGSGIKISGNAHGNAIGGFQPSIEPQVTVSANRGYGIQFTGRAHNNVVFHSYIGTNAGASADLGNRLGGVDLGPGTSSNTIGGETLPFQNKILFSRGPGVTIASSRGDMMMGNEIQRSFSLEAGGNASSSSVGSGQNGVYVTGLVTGTRLIDNQITSNSGDGVMLANARKLTIGGLASGTGNGIVANLGFGLYAFGMCSGSVVQRNVIVANAKGNVNLRRSRGITYIP